MPGCIIYELIHVLTYGGILFQKNCPVKSRYRFKRAFDGILLEARGEGH